MRTYIFKDFLNDKHGKFLPLQTIESEEFGRHFFIDIAFDFISAPSLKSGGYKDLTWKENNDNKEKAHSDFCEYMEAVENGEVTYL